MKRRGFFGVVLGAVLTPLAAKLPKPKSKKIPWRTVSTSWEFSLDPEREAEIEAEVIRLRQQHLLKCGEEIERFAWSLKNAKDGELIRIR